MKFSYLPIGYYWVPADLPGGYPFYAGITPGTFNTVAKKTLAHKKYKVSFYQFPDQQVYIAPKPVAEIRRAAKSLSFDFLSGPFLKDLVHLCMCNAFTTSRRDREAMISSEHYRVIQDSGGFQLFTGAAEFIDPIDVAKRHRGVDIGVGLDIPSYAIDNWDLMARTARVLGANNVVMREHSSTKQALLNVCHGHTLEQRLKYLDISMRDEPLDGLAISSVKGGVGVPTDPEKFARHVIASILYTKKVYSYYHVLGVATRWQMAFLAILAQRLQVRISSDSTTWAMYASAGQLHSYRHLTNSIGRRTEPMTLARNPCCCRACKVLKYLAIYRDRTVLLQAHNLESIAYQCIAFNDLARTFNDLSWIENEVPLPADKKKRSDILRVFTMLNSLKLSTVLHGERKSRTAQLFSTHSQAKAFARYKNIVRRYEKYHGKSF